MEKLSFEDLPKYESTAKHRLFGYDCKRNKNKFPMKRFLKSYIGEVWNDVHKKLHANKDKFSDVEHSVDEVIKWYVSFDHVERNHRFRDFYIDDTGILREIPKTRIVKKVDNNVYYIWIEKQLYGLRSDGLWYRLYFKDVPEPKYVWREEEYFRGHTHYVKRNLADIVYDVWLLVDIKYPDWSPWKRPVYCYKYEQVRKKELRSIKKYLKEMVKHE